MEADERSKLPAIGELMQSVQAQCMTDDFGRTATVAMLREVLDRARKTINGAGPIAQDELLAECARRLELAQMPALKRVFNLTGTVLHTNLGRALLSERAIAAANVAMRYPVNLEFDLATGRRGQREEHVERLICQMTGAEAATIVNNNAAAVLLALNTLALDGEVMVSRGELVEIGGAFRIPEVMSRAGCHLREVGTTNRTHLRDFMPAMSGDVAAIMKVHASNYEITGFTSAVPQKELSALAAKAGVPFIIDLGSGSLLDLGRFGLPAEPTPQQAIKDGATVVTFSGDKLMGGPQCGIVVGTREAVGRMRSNPMKRALRPDKIVLAALEATLLDHLNEERVAEVIPTLRCLTRDTGEIRSQADRLAPKIAQGLQGLARIEVVECFSQIGSGAQPVERLPSSGLALHPTDPCHSAQALARQFRQLPIPVIGRLHRDRFVMDLRCLDDERAFASQIGELSGGVSAA